MSLEEFRNQGTETEADSDAKSFTWKNIVKRYKNRDVIYEELNVYKFCVYQWNEN